MPRVAKALQGTTGINPMLATGTTPAGTRGRRPRRTAGDGIAGSTKGTQYLSLPRDSANAVITDNLTAGKVAGFVNAICAVERRQHGIVANDPAWVYNLAASMFSVE
jgi:hypothetical protein